MKTKSPSLQVRFMLILSISLFCFINSYSQVNLIQDGGFENGPGGGYWLEFSDNFGTPLCDLANCGNGTGTGPNTGTYFCWFGGFTGGTEEGSVTQTVTIPVSNAAVLTFFLEQIICDGSQDFLEVTIDNVVVFQTNGISPLCGILGYSMQIVDVSAFANGDPHTIQFHSITYAANGTATNFFVDDISLMTGVSGAYNVVTGKLFADFNSNSFQDAGEPGLKNILVEDTITGRTSFTNSAGNYFLTLFDTGNFVVVPPSLNNFNVLPAAIPLSFSTFGNVDSNNNFSYQPSSIVNDLSVAIAPTGPFRSGFNAWYNISYANIGTTSLVPLITFYRDNDVTYQSSTLTPSLVTTDSVQWSPGLLAPFQTGQFDVMVHINPGLPLNTLINSSVKIEPLTGDNNPVNNYHNWEVFTTGSFDPNDILVNRNLIPVTEFPNPGYLNYIIRFQNTGNDTAFTVRIENKLQSTLDDNTFEFLTASHPVELSYNPQTHFMEYTFNDILLPDSNTNEPESHGFIQYRIKPVSSLGVGDSIMNHGAIYFDFNTPVLTNVAVTEVVLPTGIGSQALGTGHRLIVYPNPVSDILTVVIDNRNGELVKIGVFDIYGRQVENIFEGQVKGENLTVETMVKGMANGIYFVLMESESGLQCRKIVKL